MEYCYVIELLYLGYIRFTNLPDDQGYDPWELFNFSSILRK